MKKVRKEKMRSKKALSPLIATVLLVVFALIIGTATMSWGRNYVENIDDEEKATSSVIISIEHIDNPLKELQIRYITDRILLNEYLEEEKSIIAKMNN
jgi:flagellin-like protein